jgi:uncharacterized membrane protein SirB2
MSLLAYKTIHVFAVVLTFTILGGLALHAANGGSRDTNTQRKLTAILHGLGLLLLLVSGFGALARLGMSEGIPGWVWAKVVLWLILGAVAATFKRGPGVARLVLWLLPVLGGIAAWLALYKPF